MAKFLPFNSIDGDRAIKAEDWAWYFGTIIGNGVFPNPTTGLQVMATSGMQIEVREGKGFINGYAFRQDNAKTLTLRPPHGLMSRVDRVVLRWDLVGRQMLVDVVTGEPSKMPMAPELTRNTEVYELALADISVGKDAIEIRTSNIKDRRYDKELCGIVTGAIEQFDFTALTTQFDEWYSSFRNQIIKEYTDYADAVNIAIDKSQAETINAKDAALKATEAAESANTAAASVYSDKKFMLLLQNDGSLLLAYDSAAV